MAPRPLPQAAATAADAEVLARVRAGQPGALAELVGLHRTHLLRYATGMLGSADRAEDVVQETFARVWQHRRRWRLDGSVRSLLFRITRNLALNEERHLGVHREWLRAEALRPSAPAMTPADDLQLAELRRALQAALEQLPPRRREIFELARFRGLTHREIAERLGLSPQTVANQMSAAIRDLKEALGPWLD